MADYAVEEGLRRIYVWRIEHAGFEMGGVEECGAPEEHIAAIARDRFGNAADRYSFNLKLLLFSTIKNRARKASSKGKPLWKRAQNSGNCP